jgi:hypothetical protein
VHRFRINGRRPVKDVSRWDDCEGLVTKWAAESDAGVRDEKTLPDASFIVVHKSAQ